MWRGGGGAPSGVPRNPSSLGGRPSARPSPVLDLAASFSHGAVTLSQLGSVLLSRDRHSLSAPLLFLGSAPSFSYGAVTLSRLGFILLTGLSLSLGTVALSRLGTMTIATRSTVAKGMHTKLSIKAKSTFFDPPASELKVSGTPSRSSTRILLSRHRHSFSARHHPTLTVPLLSSTAVTPSRLGKALP
jgi:hypothetical protein